MPGTRPFFAHHCLPLIELELSRAEGRPDPSGWLAEADELGQVGLAWDEAYALYRAAEAQPRAGWNGVPPTTLIDRAIAAAESVGATGLARSARRLLDLTANGEAMPTTPQR